MCTTNHPHQGTLHEASLSKPDINFAKAFIDTHAVQDNQRVEHAHEVGGDMQTRTRCLTSCTTLVALIL